MTRRPHIWVKAPRLFAVFGLPPGREYEWAREARDIYAPASILPWEWKP